MREAREQVRAGGARAKLPAAFAWLLAVAAACLCLAACAGAQAAWADACPAGGDHDYEVKLVRTATETEDGLRTFTCAKCGASFDQALPATGHAWGAWVRDVQPTCEWEGSEHRVCQGCGLIQERAVPALSAQGYHQWSQVSRTEPTCEGQGAIRYACTVCGQEYEEALPATGHAWGDWQVVQPATADAEGEERRVCAHDASHEESRALPRIAAEERQDEVASASAAATATAAAAEQPRNPQPQPDDEPAEANPWAPNALDGALLVYDLAALGLFAAAAAPLLHLRRWAKAQRSRAVEARLATRSGKGGRVL